MLHVLELFKSEGSQPQSLAWVGEGHVRCVSTLTGKSSANTKELCDTHGPECLSVAG